MTTITAKIDFEGCPTCGKCFSHIKPANPRNSPKPGSFLICRGCKALLIFRTVEPDSFRLPTELEASEIRQTNDYWVILGRMSK